MESDFYLLLGTNLGERQARLDTALDLIGRQIGPLISRSAIYVTEPWGLKEQADFYNMAIAVRTTLPPQEVLQRVLSIESEMGRQRLEKWGPREIDIDIILWSGGSYHSETLVIPHPHMQERGFVLIPLMEIAGEEWHPILGKSVETLYLELRDEAEVLLLEEE